MKLLKQTRQEVAGLAEVHRKTSGSEAIGSAPFDRVAHLAVAPQTRMSTVKAETTCKVSSELLEEKMSVTEFQLPKLNEAESRLDMLFAEAFNDDHPALQDWVAFKFELAALRKQLAEREVLVRNQLNEMQALESRNAQLHDQVEYQAHEIDDLRRQLEVALLPTS